MRHQPGGRPADTARAGTSTRDGRRTDAVRHPRGDRPEPDARAGEADRYRIRAPAGRPCAHLVAGADHNRRLRVDGCRRARRLAPVGGRSTRIRNARRHPRFSAPLGRCHPAAAEHHRPGRLAPTSPARRSIAAAAKQRPFLGRSTAACGCRTALDPARSAARWTCGSGTSATAVAVNLSAAGREQHNPREHTAPLLDPWLDPADHQ